MYIYIQLYTTYIYILCSMNIDPLPALENVVYPLWLSFWLGTFTHLKSWVPKGSRNIHLSITRMSIKWNTSSSLLVFLYQPICESTYQSIYQSMFLSTVYDYVIIYVCGCLSSYLYAIQRKLSQSSCMDLLWTCFKFQHVSTILVCSPKK